MMSLVVSLVRFLAQVLNGLHSSVKHGLSIAIGL